MDQTLQRRRNKMLVLSIISLFLLVVIMGIIGLFLYLTQAPSVLFKYVPKGKPTGEPEVSILNPLRERSSEKVADFFLESVKSEECLNTLASTSDDQKWIQETCEREKKYFLQSLSLVNRDDSENKTTLYYEGIRLVRSEKIISPIWIDLEKDGEIWRVIKYTCFY